MLGKLIKHELRATARIMLPVYGAVLALAVMANISLRLLQNDLAPILEMLLGLILSAFGIGLFAAMAVTVVLLIRRFYMNYLKDEGYLMHTLPVSVHSLIWSKTIVSCLWIIATMLVCWLSMLTTALIQSGTALAELFEDFPTAQELVYSLNQVGISVQQLELLGALMLALLVVGSVVSCLQFYAAMSLGQMFANNKVLLSVVFYLVINFAVSTLFTIVFSTAIGAIYAAGGEQALASYLDSASKSLDFFNTLLGFGLVFSLIEGVAFYLITWLGLKKKLNLA